MVSRQHACTGLRERDSRQILTPPSTPPQTQATRRSLCCVRASQFQLSPALFLTVKIHRWHRQRHNLSSHYVRSRLYLRLRADSISACTRSKPRSGASTLLRGICRRCKRVEHHRKLNGPGASTSTICPALTCAGNTTISVRLMFGKPVHTGKSAHAESLYENKSQGHHTYATPQKTALHPLCQLLLSSYAPPSLPPFCSPISSPVPLPPPFPSHSHPSGRCTFMRRPPIPPTGTLTANLRGAGSMRACSELSSCARSSTVTLAPVYIRNQW